MRAFISYSSQNHKTAQDIKEFLESVQINSFIAKDDLRTASDWKNTIVKELNSCELFIPLLSKEFKESSWCSQELGIAFILKKIFIPISIDNTQSYGFINHIQSKSISKLELELIIIEGLMECKIPNGVQYFIKLLKEKGDFRFSEHIYKTMEPYFMEFNNNDLNTIVRASIENVQVWVVLDDGKIEIPVEYRKPSSRIKVIILQNNIEKRPSASGELKVCLISETNRTPALW